MTEGATIFELNFKANLNYALKLNRTKPNKNEKNQINYLQKPTFCPPKNAVHFSITAKAEGTILRQAVESYRRLF
jgi:hypothetical protein